MPAVACVTVPAGHFSSTLHKVSHAPTQPDSPHHSGRLAMLTTHAALASDAKLAPADGKVLAGSKAKALLRAAG